MRKTMILALALVAGVSFSGEAAKRKNKVVLFPTPVVEPVTLISGSDSVSYAAGMTLTNGLIPYLQQQGVDTAYIADFVRGFQEAVKAADDPKVKAYTMGMNIAGQVTSHMLPRMADGFSASRDSILSEKVYRGFTDAILGDTTVFTMAVAEQLFMEREKAASVDKQEKLYGANRDAGRKFLEENARRDSVITLPSGLQYQVLKQGSGEVPLASDRVQVNYEGRLIDGTVFDASARHGDKPAEFTPSQVISGWTEALTMMPVGSTWRLFIPSELAYGERDAGQIKPFSTLIFDVELVGIVK